MIGSCIELFAIKDESIGDADTETTQKLLDLPTMELRLNIIFIRDIVTQIRILFNIFNKINADEETDTSVQ
jgi:hypothetical protein